MVAWEDRGVAADASPETGTSLLMLPPRRMRSQNDSATADLRAIPDRVESGSSDAKYLP